MPLYAKLWTDILGDEKLMRAARKGAKHLVILPWLFAFAKKVDDNGRLTVDGEPAEPDDISALIPGVTPRQVAACFEELERIKVLVRDDDGALCLAAWEHRSGSGSKPSDAPESVADRVRKHRQRKRQATADSPNETPSETRSVTPDVTRSETPDVTPLKRGVTSYARSREEEGEEEKEKELEKEQEEEARVALHASAAKRPSTTAKSVAAQLVSSAHRAAYHRVISKAPVPEAWDAEMVARLSGMHGPPITAEQLGQALLDYVGNGSVERPNFKHFRGYLDNAARAPIAASVNGVRERPDWQLSEREKLERAAKELQAEEDARNAAVGGSR